MYTYQMMLSDIENFGNVSVIGITSGGRAIPCIHTGSKRGRQIIVCAAIHAREHITAALTVIMARHYENRALNGGIYFIPMVNSDGVCLAVEGLKSVKSIWDRKNLILLNGGSEDFSLWKANLNGVDLNVNFDARFGTGKLNEKIAGSENYIGESPFCEAESRALRDFTLKVKPSATISYHCKGEVIYWKFYQEGSLLRDSILAGIIAAETAYTLVDECGSAGGYKDWCIEKLGIPAFTIEVGNDKFSHPFPYSELEDILKRNINVPSVLLKNL